MLSPPLRKLQEMVHSCCLAHRVAPVDIHYYHYRYTPTVTHGLQMPKHLALLTHPYLMMEVINKLPAIEIGEGVCSHGCPIQWKKGGWG